MNPTWQDFLTSQSISNTASHNALYGISHLSILKISGTDAADFLQGQLTCNTKELNAKNSFFAGFCNAKGRVISTFLILKHNEDFLLILPSVLLEKVKNKLKMYVLRSKVQLQEASAELCLTGLRCTQEIATDLSLPTINFARNNQWIKLPNAHYLSVATIADAMSEWTNLQNNAFQMQNAQDWQSLDMQGGLAWLDETSSEEYIPQMLNLDKLGGVSFTKGCYTGQEIVARTHYLGKTKRELFLAQLTAEATFTNDNNVLDETGQMMGQILSTFREADGYKILLVLQTNAVESAELQLNNAKHDKINLIPFVTV